MGRPAGLCKWVRVRGLQSNFQSLNKPNEKSPYKHNSMGRCGQRMLEVQAHGVRTLCIINFPERTPNLSY